MNWRIRLTGGAYPSAPSLVVRRHSGHGNRRGAVRGPAERHYFAGHHPVHRRIRGTTDGRASPSGQARRVERPVDPPRFYEARCEEERVERDHHPVVRLPRFDATSGQRPARIAPREHELNDSLQCDDGHHTGVPTMPPVTI